MSLPDILFNSPEATVAERGSTMGRSSRAELADSLMKSMKEDASGEVIERRGNTVSRKRVEGAGGWTGGLQGINWSSGLSAIGVGGSTSEVGPTSDKIETPAKSPTLPTPPPLSPFAAEFPSTTLVPPATTPAVDSLAQPDSTTSTTAPPTDSPVSPAPLLSGTSPSDTESLPAPSVPAEQDEQPTDRFDKIVGINLGRELGLDSTACLRVIFVRLGRLLCRI